MFPKKSYRSNYVLLQCQQYGPALGYVPRKKRTEKLCFAAVKQNGCPQAVPEDM